MTEAPQPTSGPWAPLRHRAFLVIWLAVLASNIGTWVRDVASGWLMTEMAPSPVLVSLVQAATTLPIFLLSLPAGALADIVDRRRMLIFVQCALLLIAASLAVLSHLGMMTPELLLGLVLAGGVCAALAGPAFQAVTPELVDRSELRSAVALNSLGVNIARAIGPALGGLIVASAGAASAYGVDAISYLLVIAALVWWRAPRRSSDLPPEGFRSAIVAGIRYASRSGELKVVLVRTGVFFLFGSAYWALLPLVARQVLGGDATYYGFLLAAIGAGAVLGALALPRLRIGGDRLVLLGSLLTAGAVALLATVPSRALAPVLFLVLGGAWIFVLTSLNVAAQSVLPNWVRARGMAVYLTVFYGGMTLGSAGWGFLAQQTSVTQALLIAGATGAVAALAAARLKLPAGDQDLSPARHWAEPVTAGPVEGDAGPVMIAVTYDIDPADRSAFLTVIHELSRERRRDGGFGWRVFEDAETPGRFIEIWLTASWLEHLRQHQRVSRADADLQDRVKALHRAKGPPRVQHLIAARPGEAAVRPVDEYRSD
jgi:MFS family permease/quinol monooxygenase YgiN